MIFPTQREVAEETEARVPFETSYDVGMGMQEESGEVARALLKRKQGVRGSYDEWTASAQTECADVLLKCMHFAHREGFDLWDAVTARWAELSARGSERTHQP